MTARPRRLASRSTADTVNSLLWTQQLWLDDLLIWSAESLSATAATPVRASAGTWRATNALAVAS